MAHGMRFGYLVGINLMSRELHPSRSQHAGWSMAAINVTHAILAKNDEGIYEGRGY